MFLDPADVQPVDPLELWDTPPFEPHVDLEKDMLFHGRGVSDDKGGLLQPIHVCLCPLACHSQLLLGPSHGVLSPV